MSGPSASRSLVQHLPNVITLLRVALVPLWGVAAEASRAAQLAGETDTHRVWCVVILGVIGASDVVDGWLARRFGLMSRAGATLDALADKLAQVGLVTFFTFRGSPAFAETPLWFWLLLFGRDVVLGCGWLLVRSRCGTVRVVHHIHGKLVSVLLFFVLLWLSAGRERGVDVAVVVIAVLVVASTVSYFRDGWVQWRAPAPSSATDTPGSAP